MYRPQLWSCPLPAFGSGSQISLPPRFSHSPLSEHGAKILSNDVNVCKYETSTVLIVLALPTESKTILTTRRRTDSRTPAPSNRWINQRRSTRFDNLGLEKLSQKRICLASVNDSACVSGRVWAKMAKELLSFLAWTLHELKGLISLIRLTLCETHDDKRGIDFFTVGTSLTSKHWIIVVTTTAVSAMAADIYK